MEYNINIFSYYKKNILSGREMSQLASEIGQNLSLFFWSTESYIKKPGLSPNRKHGHTSSIWTKNKLIQRLTQSPLTFDQNKLH